ncbi:MAG TPA: sec-independent translocase [Actinocrinis sp.]|nr:sec-independent translocase [Actinocrinis sp.]
MFFDLSLPEIVVLLGLGVVLFGPDKLPSAAASAARFLRQVRAFSENARNDLRNELGPEFQGLGLEDLNPKTFVRKNLLGESEDLRGLAQDLRDPLGLSSLTTGSGPANGNELPAQRATAQAALPAGERPPFDDDAT